MTVLGFVVSAASFLGFLSIGMTAPLIAKAITQSKRIGHIGNLIFAYLCLSVNSLWTLYAGKIGTGGWRAWLLLVAWLAAVFGLMQVSRKTSEEEMCHTSGKRPSPARRP